jgi:glutathione synthase/RimK-type ligase-like ATP-grasp enzyme
MRIALATARELPRPDHDLPILVDAFASRGADVEIVAWEDAQADWRAFDAVVVRSTWNYLAHLEAFRAWIDRVGAATRLVNAPAVLRWNLHKSYLVEFARAGLDVVPTVLHRAGEEIDWHAHFERFGELVVKPAVSAGSFATIRVARGDVANVRDHHLEHAERDLLVQPCLASVVAHGETNLVHFGARFSHAIHKGARWKDDAEQSRGLVEPAADERALAGAILGHVRGLGLGEIAYARVDLARGADGRPLLMELEVLEPSLFLDRAPDRASLLVDAVLGDA